MVNDQRKILVYDDTCATCRVLKTAVSISTSAYDFVGTSSDEGRKLIAERNLDTLASAYTINGEHVSSRSNAVIDIIYDIRIFGPFLAATIRKIPLKWRDESYDWLARHRFR